MIDQTLRHAVERQENFRREAAGQRRMQKQPNDRRILASVAAILRAAFANPIPAGTVLPATH